jgi:TPR repeat protein
MLGCMYDEGRGVERDVSRAIEWLRRSAEQGDAIGQIRLAQILSRGAPIDTSSTTAVGGVDEKNGGMSEALEWFRRGRESSMSNGEASLVLSRLYQHGSPPLVDANADLSLEWLRRAVEKGVKAARDELEATSRTTSVKPT